MGQTLGPSQGDLDVSSAAGVGLEDRQPVALYGPMTDVSQGRVWGGGDGANWPWNPRRECGFAQ